MNNETCFSPQSTDEKDIPKRWKEGTRGPCRFICKHCLITDGSTSIRQHHRQCSQCQQSKPKCKTDRPESQLIWKRKQDRCLFVR
ncbi:unnamed protein product [Lactuca virosa]|uniref:Uncharacterized protein n=1 Tax=Lactuca virosa TaxID=75947 RepID=A0AAU9MEV7_9ASTR|nr:unnamed protein product [Lactuca virosa]